MSRVGTHARRSPATSDALYSKPAVALIADDDARERIAAILAHGGLGFDMFTDVEELLDAKSDPSLILVWVEDADSSLSKTVESLAHRFEQTPIVAACPYIERWEMRSALAAGAAGAVLHDNLEAALVPCLQAVLAGQTCVPRDHWRQIEPPALSAREKQILGLVVMGYMNSQIAEQLFLAESTVKSHLSSAFGKLGVRSRNEAVNLILDPERGLGMGILALGGEPVEPASTVAG
ncbi:MAG TPA: response regulator transcription factor [Solirubrobacteraceae bacterium]|jgi:DNA-binding NarL/FixJ family response regulator|nr:response regulator transcription factor [Solirubrobacteraceae bacterium]